MSFIEKNLSNNEQILYKGKIHWFIYLRGVIFVALGLATTHLSQGLSALLFVFGIVVLIMALSLAKSSEFAVTNRRVILKTGMLSRKIVELQLNKSEGLQVSQSILGRIFNYGTIRISSAGVVESFPFLSAPFEFKKQVNNAIEGSFQATPNASAY